MSSLPGKKPGLNLSELRGALALECSLQANLAPHKSNLTLELIRAAGAQVRFLPACSPGLNRIEKMGSKVKSLLRSAQARTPEELIAEIGRALAQVTAKDAPGWFASCGCSFC